MKFELIIILLAVLTLSTLSASAGKLTISDMRCEYRVSPIGIDSAAPRLSWVLHSDQRAQGQSAYRILVWFDETAFKQTMLWDSGKVASDRTNQIPYEGIPLKSNQKCYWKVRVWDKSDEPSEWSLPAKFSTGLLEHTDWKGGWIGYDELPDGATEKPEMPPPPYMRKSFKIDKIDKPIKRAVLYVSALGLYEMHINGNLVSDGYFTPGDCDFHKRTYYLAYEVGRALRKGDNVIGAILGEGWYAGYLAFTGRREFYGGRPRLQAQLNIEFTDGTSQVIASDETWKASYGPINHADILMGCEYDSRKELTGWDKPGYDDSAWKPVVGNANIKQHISAKPDEPVRGFEQIKAVKLTEPKPGAYTYDFGQNLVGWVRLKVHGKPGQKVTVRHAEMLNPDKTIYTTNLRAARCIDTYYLKGGEETLEPYFTFHGFQYAEITGLDAPPAVEDVTGIVVHSDIARTGDFSCSNKLVNQLFHNIIWGQKGNYLEIPTDCPQRDERAGWTGDAQFFMPTAAYNFDVAAFFTKWLVDLITDGQHPDGAFPDVAPDLNLGAGNTAWGDAALICTYLTYMYYGDTRVIEQHYDAMAKWVETELKTSNDYVRGQGAYGDWLNLGGGAKPEVVGTAYFAYTAQLMSKMAAAIGKTDDAKRYSELADKVKDSFIRHFVSDDGGIQDSSQTGYALAFTMGLLPEKVKKSAADKFVKDIESRKWHLATGFIGTPRLLPSLNIMGRDDIAYKLLLQETFPSWLFQVTLGATTMWERWDGWTPDKGFQDAGMNSFNHYAFGAVGEYLYGGIGGIRPTAPGFKKITIKPAIQDGLDWAKASYNSINGLISSSWKKTPKGLALEITVPVNTTAQLIITAKNADSITENGKPANKIEGVKYIGAADGLVTLDLGSGKYSFTVK